MIMNSILDTLNKEQRAAAEAIDGPVMVFAGAGTGKTKTLIARIINMIQNHNIKPYNILAITFTKKCSYCSCCIHSMELSETLHTT